MSHYLQSSEDVQVLQESLLSFKHNFIRANKLKNSEITLVNVSAISKIEVSLQFKLQTKDMFEGFHLKFRGLYIDDNLKALASDISKQLEQYTSKLDSIVEILKATVPKELYWVLEGDKYDLYMFACWRHTETSRAHYSVQFEQQDLLDVSHLADRCLAGAKRCLEL